VARIANFGTDLAIDILRWYKRSYPDLDVVVDAGFHMYSYPEYTWLEVDTLYLCSFCMAELKPETVTQLVMHESLEYEITKERYKCYTTGCKSVTGDLYSDAGSVTILKIRAAAHSELLKSYPEYNQVLPEISRIHTQHFKYFLREAFGP